MEISKVQKKYAEWSAPYTPSPRPGLESPAQVYRDVQLRAGTLLRRADGGTPGGVRQGHPGEG